jgi:hypothetical protein
MLFLDPRDVVVFPGNAVLARLMIEANIYHIDGR